MNPARQQDTIAPGAPQLFFGSLESLRGVAAMLVALYHVTWLNPTQSTGLVRNSYLMVDMFFVLSGFVMCHGYGSRIRNLDDLRDFFLLRFGRLYPLHVAMLGVFLAKEIARYGAQTWLHASRGVPAFSENTGKALVSNLLLMQSLGLHDRLTFNGPSWSISAEFYTYIVFGVLVLATRNWLKPAQWAAFAAISTLSFGVLIWAGRRDLNVMYDLGWFRCTMSFFLGAASYFVLTRSHFLRRHTLQSLLPYIAVAGLAGGALFLARKIDGPSDFLFPPMTALLVLVLAAAPRTAINGWLQYRPLIYLGKVSYSIYMVHFVLGGLFASALVSVLHFKTAAMAGTQERVIMTGQTSGTVALLLYVASVLIVSHMTFTYIEEPFRWRTKAWVVNLRAQRAEARRIREQQAC
jgi:peptidoglycan/LPS O-acetylase OafA/YrhL